MGRHVPILILLAGVSLCAPGCEPPGRKIAQTKPGAPAGAKFLDVRDDPRDVYFGVTGARAKGDAELEALYMDRWIPKSGWEGTVEAVSPENGGYAIRMYYAEPRIIGGGMWDLAEVAEKPDCSHGWVVTFDGRIHEVESGVKGGTARVLVDGVTILSSRRGN